MKYIANAFSLNMLGPEAWIDLPVRRLSLQAAKRAAEGAKSVVGHTDTAAVFSATLGRPVLPNRESVTLQRGDLLVVGQYRGPRLPEGATSLPDGATIEWLAVGVGCEPTSLVCAGCAYAGEVLGDYNAIENWWFGCDAPEVRPCDRAFAVGQLAVCAGYSGVCPLPAHTVCKEAECREDCGNALPGHRPRGE